MIIDLRSDTVTRPTPDMLDAMITAKVGDDVFGEDPTVLALEEKAAKLFGKEAAVYCPSGTMTNQIAIKVHTQPQDEVVCSKYAHIYNYEGGGMMFNSAVSPKFVDCDRGRYTAQSVEAAINPRDDVHFPYTKLVSIENTSNKGGGCYWDLSEIKQIRAVCDQHNLKLHLDGARLFNALAETGESPLDYGQQFDSISICLSKGLGAPIGSLLLGEKEFIWQARRTRKPMGGAMRQAGFLAAAGIFALDHHVARLKEDHHRAKKIGEMVSKLDYAEKVLPIDTNIVLFELNDSIKHELFLQKLKEHGVLAVPMAAQMVRFVTHLDFNDTMLERLETILPKLSF